MAAVIRIWARSARVRWLAVPWSEATLAVTLVAAAAAPVFLAASADVWRAASEDDIAARAVESAVPERNGVDVVYEVAFDPGGIATASVAVEGELARMPDLAPVDTTLYTLPGLITIGPPVRQVGPTGRLLARDGALDAVEIVDQLDDTSNGVWITRWFADRHDLELGDGLGFEAGAIVDEEWNDLVQGGGAGSVFRIVGTYEQLWSAEPDFEPSSYWRAAPPPVVPQYIGAFNGPNSELVLTEEDTLLASGLTGAVQWRAAPSDLPETMEELRDSRDRMRRFELALVGGGALDDALTAIATPTRRPPLLRTDLFHTVDEVERAARRLAGPLGSSRAVGTTVGLVGLAAVGLFLVERRRTEFRLLASEGEQWPVMSARVAAQLLAPVLVGTGAGVAAAVWGLWWFGPAEGAEWGSVVWSAVVVVAVVGWAIAALTAGVAGGRTLRRPQRAVNRTIAWGFGAVVVFATGFTWVQIGRTAASADVDLAVVALPVLAVLVAVTGALAAVGWVLRRAAPTPGRMPLTAFLAVRRLATSAGGLRVVTGAIGLGVGLLVFAIALTSTLDRMVDAKIATEVIGETSLALIDEPDPATVLSPTTTIVRTFDTTLTPGGGRVRVIAIDPATWAGAVTWPDAFGSDPAAVLALLDRDLDGAVPVVAVRGEPAPSAGAFGLNQKFGYEIVGRVASMPGAGAAPSTLLVAGPALDALAIADAGYATAEAAEAANYRIPTSRFRRRLVSQDTPETLIALLESTDVRFRDIVTQSERRRDPAVLAARAAFGYLGVLGVAAASGALVALGLHLAARRRQRALGGLMIRSMGLSAVRTAAVTTLELVVELTIAVVAAFVAVPFVVRRLSSRFDPAPDLPPPVEVSVAWAALIGSAVACAAAIAAVVWWVEWRRDRRPTDAVVRDAG